jgi:heme oxygenase
LIALGAIALSITGYVIQEARNTARQDSEIEATKARVVHLEQIAATNTEARIRTEVQLGELRDGQLEIKALIQAHDSASKKAGLSK